MTNKDERERIARLRREMDALERGFMSKITTLILLAIIAVLTLEWISPVFGQAPPGFEIFADGFEGTTDYCNDPMVQPEGWSRSLWTWERAWSTPNCFTPTGGTCSEAVYPNGVGAPVPIGSNRTGYRSISFTPLPNQSVNLTWDVVQANASIGYPKAYPSAGMWVAISPCEGDLRLPSFSGDPYLRSGCRKFNDKGGLTYSDAVATSDHQVCKVTPGIVHYMTVTPHWPELGPDEHTCVLDNFAFCHVGARIAQSKKAN